MKWFGIRALQVTRFAQVLSLIQSWAHAFSHDPELQGVAEIYIDLKKKGIQFPVPSDDDLLLVQSMQPGLRSPSHSSHSASTPTQSPTHSNSGRWTIPSILNSINNECDNKRLKSIKEREDSIKFIYYLFEIDTTSTYEVHCTVHALKLISSGPRFTLDLSLFARGFHFYLLAWTLFIGGPLSRVFDIFNQTRLTIF